MAAVMSVVCGCSMAASTPFEDNGDGTDSLRGFV